MKVSVIMAVYNVGNEYIVNSAVNSILTQTFSDFEFIICDDCSTDCTFEFLKDIAKKDTRVKLLRNSKNMMAGWTRNRCIEMAQGDYIAIMDGDDISVADRLEKQVAFLDQHPDINFVGTRAQYFRFNPSDCDTGYWFCPKPEKRDFLFTSPFLHATLMFRREALADVHGYSTEKLVTRCEDYDMLLRMYAKGMAGVNINQVLYYYRVDENTLRKRKYRYRFNEVAVKFRGFYQCGLFPQGIVFAIKPLLVGLIPLKLLEKMKKKYYRDN